MKKSVLILACVFVMTCGISAQSGGVYSIAQSVTGNGGGDSSGGTFSVTGTIGQSLTAVSTQTPYKVESGFWQISLAPTAAGVSISGRVIAADGRGVRNASVTLVDQTGTTRYARTGSFGYYHFQDLEAGQTVIISVNSKRFQFLTQIVSPNENLSGIDFIAIGK
jgi:hypothetical protein